jgi:probable F420-dependent oxidoreductase
MEYGVVFPQTEIGTNAQTIRSYARAAEDLDFDYLLAFDHVLGANPANPGPWQNGPYDYTTMFHEPLVLFGHLAAVTKRIKFATGILILPQRQTVLVAKQAAEVDVLSGGRLRIGVGVGWNPAEYEALDMDFHTRGRREAEQVQVLHKLWTRRLVEFEGEFHHLPDVGLHPLPIQRPIPIWFGGGSEATLRRMAKLGDGWMPNAQSLDALAENLARLRGYIRDAGRDPAAFGVDVRIDARRQDEETWLETLERLKTMDITHVCINTMGLGYTPDQHIEAIGRFKAVVDSA